MNNATKGSSSMWATRICHTHEDLVDDLIMHLEIEGEIREELKGDLLSDFMIQGSVDELIEVQNEIAECEALLELSVRV